MTSGSSFVEAEAIGAGGEVSLYAHYAKSNPSAGFGRSDDTSKRVDCITPFSMNEKSEENILFKLPTGALVFWVLFVPSYAFAADKALGEIRYNESCVNCHGKAGKGASSYPKVSGLEVSYTIEKLRAYRDGIKQGPNSALMIMMAKPLTDEEIDNLAAYLEDATHETQ